MTTPPPRRYGLSKSKIAMFEQCAKRLWLAVQRPHLSSQGLGSNAGFTIGNTVGEIARSLVPGGIMVDAERGLSAAVAATRTLLNEDRPIFEATLQHDGVLVRVDILEPDTAGGWRMVEVKSSTGPRDYQLGDIATQLWVAERMGVRVGSAALRHINSGFVLAEEGDYRGLLADADVTALVEPIVAERDEVIAAARETLSGDEPTTTPGDHCSKPFTCEFCSYCHAALPADPEWPVTVLPGGGGKRWLAEGVVDLFAVDPAALTSNVHKRVHQATTCNTVYHDIDAARATMGAWAYPRTWLDFETIGFAVPRWIGTRPYQQVPFQFSAHVEAADGTMQHHEFLSLDGTDPRRACGEALVAMVPATGAVVAYNAGFERGCIVELVAAFPDLADALQSIANRLVDLLPVARACWYHRGQRGSWSIKAVLPTIAPEMDYAHLDVKNGMAAQEAYLEATAPETAAERRAELDRALRTYCGRDTEAMIVLARRLAHPVGE